MSNMSSLYVAKLLRRNIYGHSNAGRGVWLCRKNPSQVELLPSGGCIVRDLQNLSLLADIPAGAVSKYEKINERCVLIYWAQPISSSSSSSSSSSIISSASPSPNTATTTSTSSTNLSEVATIALQFESSTDSIEFLRRLKVITQGSVVILEDNRGSIPMPPPSTSATPQTGTPSQSQIKSTISTPSTSHAISTLSTISQSSPMAFHDLWECDKSEMPSVEDPSVQYFIMKLLFSEEFKIFTEKLEKMLETMKNKIP